MVFTSQKFACYYHKTNLAFEIFKLVYYLGRQNQIILINSTFPKIFLVLMVCLGFSGPRPNANDWVSWIEYVNNSVSIHSSDKDAFWPQNHLHIFLCFLYSIFHPFPDAIYVWCRYNTYTIGPHIMWMVSSSLQLGIIAQNSKIVVANNSLAKHYGFELSFSPLVVVQVYSSSPKML